MGGETVRIIRPTDLLGLLLSDLRALPDEAVPRERIGRGERKASLVMLPLREWPPMGRKRQTWVCARGRSLLGLASIRCCVTPSTWEVDHLLSVPEARAPMTELLEKLGVAAGQLGAERIFLRLLSESRLKEGSQQAGFSPYTTETLYHFEGSAPEIVRACKGLRSRAPANGHGLFRLYNAATPVGVRQAEGLTSQEWQEAKELRWGKQTGKEFVKERGGNLVGWLRLAGEGRRGYMDVMAQPGDEDALQSLVYQALEQLKGRSPIMCLVPHFQGDVARFLTSLGFKEAMEYTALVKRVTAKARQPCFVPARV